MKPRGPYTIHETPMTLSVPLLTPEMWVICVKCGNRRTLEEIGTVGPIACTCGSTTYETDVARVVGTTVNGWIKTKPTK